MNISVTKCEKRGVMPPVDKLGFGNYFTDHMFIMDYDEQNGWHDARIVPFGPLTLSPAATVFHYGAEVFEGMKAYRRPDGGVQLFRPWDNVARLNRSCERLGLPQLNPDDGLQAIRELVKLDQDWVPYEPGTSLYIRPFLFGSDAKLGLHGVHSAMFVVIMSPVGSYFAEGLKPVIQDLTVQLHSFPALLAETSLQVSGNAGQYTEDEEIKWKFSVNSEQKAEITGTEGYEDWKNHIAVYLYLDDGSGEKQKLPGDIEKGWSYTTEAQTDEQTVRAYLTGGAAPEVGDKPACETEYTGYAQEKLLDNCLAEAKLTVTGGKPEYQMNDEISLQITAADAKLLQEAWDPDGKIVELEVKLAPEVEYDLTGALDEGWTLTFPARQDTQLRATLFAGEGQNRVEGEMYSAICTVAGRSLPEHLACLLHGKEDWEFQPSMMNRLYLVAGIVAAVLVVLAVVILWGTKKNFVGMLTIEVDTDVEHYQSKIIDLRDWKKKKVAFGALLSGSGLPPITALTASDVMNKLFIKPVKGGIRVINKTRTLEGGNCPLTQESNQVSMTGGDGIAKISLIYKA